MNQIPFSDGMALADCAARCLNEWRTSKHSDPDSAKVRQILRQSPVAALRYLWKTGDASQRTTVAARILVWLRTKSEYDMPTALKRIGEREKLRLTKP